MASLPDVGRWSVDQNTPLLLMVSTLVHMQR